MQDPLASAYAEKLAGKPLSEIAANYGYDTSELGRLIRERLNKESRFLNSDERESLVALELARLDTLMQAHWPLAVQHRDKDSSAVVMNCIKLRIQLLKLDLADASMGAQTVLVVAGEEKDFIKGLKQAVDG